MFDIIKDTMSSFTGMFGDNVTNFSLVSNSFISMLDLVHKKLLHHFESIESKKFTPQIVFVYYDKSIAIQILLQYAIKITLFHMK